MAFNRERERFDNPIVLFNNHSLSMSRNSGNNILPLKFLPDEISSTIDVNSSMGVNFSDKGDLPFCNREIKMSIGVNISFKGKTLWQMSEGLPVAISEYARESCAVFFLGKTSMWFLVMVISQKAFAGSSKRSKCRTIMSSDNSFLPELIKTFNRGISSWFSLRDEYKMNSHKQMKTNNLRNAIWITTSTSSSHLIIHLRYLRKPHKSPCFNEMPTKGDSLLISKLTGKCRMSCNIHSVKRIKPDNSFCPSDISRSNKVCLMNVPHILCLNVRIGLIIVISFGLNSTSFSVTRENPGNTGNRWNIANLPLFEFPMDNLCPNTSKGRSSGLVSFQFCSDGKYLFNHMLGSFSPDTLWGTTFIFETFKSLLFKSFEPFGEPPFTSLNQLEYLIETKSILVKLYCLTAFFIFILITHRLSLLLNVFRRSLGDIKKGSRCYDIFLVHDVMI